MGSYRQHVGVAATLGVGYASAATLLAGVHWLYSGVAALLTTLGGLLPDLDSDHSVQLRGFTGFLGLVAALLCWSTLRQAEPGVAFELRLWALIIPYVLVRHVARRVLQRMTVHRGMWHSVPALMVAGGLVLLVYPSGDPWLRAFMAVGVMLGVLSHLMLDEVCSVDLRGRRVNKAFGTALKLWSKSGRGTLVAYVLLSLVTWGVIESWPFPRPWTPPDPPAGWPPAAFEAIRSDWQGRFDSKPLGPLGIESGADGSGDEGAEADAIILGPTPRPR